MRSFDGSVNSATKYMSRCSCYFRHLTRFLKSIETIMSIISTLLISLLEKYTNSYSVDNLSYRNIQYWGILLIYVLYLLKKEFQSLT